MPSLVKKLGVLVSVLLICGLAYGIFYINQRGPIGTGYAAKVLCSSVFVSGRDPASVMDMDLAIARKNFISATIDPEEQSATASLFGLYKRKAVYREGLGCTLAVETPVEALKKDTPAMQHPTPETMNRTWPKGDKDASESLPEGVDSAGISRALDQAFTETHPEKPIHTRAVVVVYDGSIIAERYAQGWTKDTPLLGWSMTKSVTNALVGILVGKGALSVQAPAPVPEWQEAGDPRKAITLDQLLRMSSGLEFKEEYESSPRSDVNVMLFMTRDMAAYAASKPLIAQPDSRWSYSSGTTNIISRIVRAAVEGSGSDYQTFPRQALFDKIGMHSAVMEPDASGTFVGSSYLYATARDWARFGLLYLNDGVWNDERILPEGWVGYSKTPTPNAPPEDSYGAQFWLNSGGKDRWMPDLPQDTFSALGHHGQAVVIIPSRKLVVVRLGFSEGYKSAQVLGFIKPLLDALPETGSE